MLEHCFRQEILKRKGTSRKAWKFEVDTRKRLARVTNHKCDKEVQMNECFMVVSFCPAY